MGLKRYIGLGFIVTAMFLLAVYYASFQVHKVIQMDQLEKIWTVSDGITNYLKRHPLKLARYLSSSQIDGGIYLPKRSLARMLEVAPPLKTLQCSSKQNPKKQRTQINACPHGLESYIHNGRVFLSIKVADKYRDKSKSNLTSSGDRVEVTFLDFELVVKPFGREFTPKIREYDGSTAYAHEAQASWVELEDQYIVKVNFPFDWAKSGLAVRAINDDQGEQVRWGYKGLSNTPMMPRYHDKAISKTIDLFDKTGAKITLIDRHEWILGQEGEIETLSAVIKRDGNQFYWWLRGYQWLFGLTAEGEAPKSSYGKMVTMLEGNGHVWYRYYNDENVLRVEQSFYIKGTPFTLVVEESFAQGVVKSQTVVLGYFLTVAVTGGILCLGLIFYCLRLISRINRIESTLENLMSESEDASKSNINRLNKKSSVVASKGDAIDRLQYSYQQLIDQIEQHKHYLKKLASKLAHELKTPLAIMQTSLDAAKYAEPTETHSHFDKLEVGIVRLEDILIRMSEVDAIEDSVKSTECQKVDLDRFLQVLLTLYQKSYGNVRLLDRLDKVGEVFCSTELVAQAFDKLMDNAVGYTPDNGKVVMICYESEGQIVLGVENEGSSLPEDVDIFECLTSIRTAKGEATHLGLGLYVVKLVAQAHGGQVYAYNLEQDPMKASTEAACPMVGTYFTIPTTQRS